MLLSNGSVKLRSLGLSTLVLTLAAGMGGAATSGCFFVRDDHDDSPPVYVDEDKDDDVDPDTDPDVEPPSITQVAIQPDQALDAAPGEGVGIFVQYATGGQWRIWTTCDTFVSKSVCSFDIFAGTPKLEQLRAYSAENVEGYDTVKDLGDGTIEFLADTDSDTDVLSLEMDPGAPLDLEVYLDGQSAEAFIYWVSDDVIHAGAPENPIQFRPVAP